MGLTYSDSAGDSGHIAPRPVSIITPSRPVAAASLTKANFSTVIENKKSSACNCNNHRQGENICHDSEACAGAYETNQIFMLQNVIGNDTAQR